MSSPAIAVPNDTQKYALTKGAVLMATEDAAEYERHVNAQYEQYKPVAEHEIFMTQELADAIWRMNRARQWNRKPPP
jgi:hypothetical protein